MDEVDFYEFSMSEAKQSGELDLWRESYKENCNCARFIEETIRSGFDGMNLDSECAKTAIDRFGYSRVNWVLANTVREHSDDGRYSPTNKAWAKRFAVPKDENNWQFCVGSHPAVVDGFVNQLRREWQKLGLFDSSHCESEADGEIDYTGKVVVINPDILKDEYKAPEDQLFLAESGFGCAPNSRGRKVFGHFLKDGEQTHYQRHEILGVLKDEHLPDWAREKLNTQTDAAEPAEEQVGGITLQ